MDNTRPGHRRLVAIAIALFALAACGREQWTTVATQTVASPPSAEPTADPTAKPTTTPRAPRPEPVQAASAPQAPASVQPIPSTDLPGGPDGEDETKRDSGVRGQVLAGDRPIADVVVFVKGDGFQSNSTTGGTGRFHIHAPAGEYLVGARANNASVHCTDRTVKVEETSFTTITINCAGGG